MRTFAIVCLAGLVLVSAAPAAAQSTGNQAGPLVKETQPTGKPTFEGRVEGETIETAFVIDYLPFEDSGDTCPFLHDYDEACPYTFSASPDVVYSYYCPFDCTVVIDLCASQYDTKVFVYENEYSPGNPFACNDDSPGCGPDGYRSWLMLEFTQGNTYFVVVDGYTCGLTELTETLAAGTWWLWVGPIGFTGVQCGEEYACELTGYAPVTPVERASWSTLKAMHR
ncbi:MAG: hypothetical protein ABIK85_03790 [Candidatus Eisenbacteria bacterium]